MADEEQAGNVTSYMVLLKQQDAAGAPNPAPALWAEFAQVDSTGGAPGARKQAAEAYAQVHGGEAAADIELLAVPMRSWQPRKGRGKITFTYNEEEPQQEQLPATSQAAPAPAQAPATSDDELQLA